VPGTGLTGEAVEEELRTEDELRLEELEPDLEEDEPDLTEEDEPEATVSDEELISQTCPGGHKGPVPDEDAPCSESEELSGSVLGLLGGKGSSPCPEEELTLPCVGEEEEVPLAMEEDESSDPPTGGVGSVCGSGLLQVIRKNTNATIAGSARRTLRFTIRFINTSR